MPPMMMLLASDTAIFNTEPSSSRLLPAGATEPQVEFADILRLGTELVLEPELDDGQLLPAGGNALPTEAIAGDEIATPVEIIELAVDAAVNPAAALPTSSSISVIAVTPNPQALQQSLPVPAPTAEIALNVALPESQTPAPATGKPAADDGQNLQQPVGLAAKPLVTRPIPEMLTVQKTPELVAVPVAAGNESRLLTDQLRGSSRAPSRQGALEQLARALDGSVSRSARNHVADLPRELPPLPILQSTTQALQSPLTSAGPIEVPIGQPTQPGPLQLNQALPQPATETLSPAAQASQTIEIPVKDAAWGEQIGQRIQLMAGHKLQNVEIRLTPAELGPLRVQVSVDDGATNVTFHAQHAVTRDAIEQALPRLRELLAESGLTLDQTNVSDQGAARGEREGGDDTGVGSHPGNDVSREQAGDDPAMPQQRVRVANGLVDTFV